MTQTTLSTYKQMVREISRYPVLSKKEETTLRQRVEQGDGAALDKLVKHNFRLVRGIAERYRGFSNSVLDIEDIIQEGLLALTDAILVSDWRKGRLGPYAASAIQRGIRRSIDYSGGSVRMPAQQHEKIRKFKKVEKELVSKLGYEPDFEDVANEANLDYIEMLELIEINGDAISLDSSSSDYQEDWYRIVGTDEDAFTKLLVPEGERVDDRIYVVIGNAGLTERQRNIVELRFGLNGKPPSTLKEIADQFETDTGSIAKSQKKALSKLAKGDFDPGNSRANPESELNN